FEKRHLARVIGGTARVSKRLSQIGGAAYKTLEIRFVPRPEIPGGHESRAGMILVKQAKGLDELVQSLFGTDAGEVSDRKRTAGDHLGKSIVPGQIDSQRHNVHLVVRQFQQVGHVVAVVGAVHQKPVEELHMPAQQLQGLLSPWLDQIVEKDV